MIKTRFAPSPTGYIHLGNARTAIHSALLALSTGNEDTGKFQLRIEDTDEERSKIEFIQAVQDDLKQLGWSWQEGIQVGGPNPPYQQSQRNHIYRELFNQLIECGYAYECFCDESTLKQMRMEQKLSGQPPRYDGRCKRLDSRQKHQKKSLDQSSVLRFNIDQVAKNIADEIQFDDLVKGNQRFPLREMGDFIIRKQNGSPTFFFSNAVDDSMMGITHVLRGDDHLTNTPRQIMLLKALNLEIPHYAHLSTIVGEDGQPFSKRNGSRSIRQLLAEGWLPSAINNYLARLGHYYADNEWLTNQQLGSAFSLAKLSKSAAKFDWAQLQHWQRQAIMQLSPQQQWQWIKPVIGDALANQTTNEPGDQLDEQLDDQRGERFAAGICNNILLPHEAHDYFQIVYATLPELSPQDNDLMHQQTAVFFQTALSAYQQGADFKAITEQVKQQTGAKGKRLFMPLRLALTGRQHGPEMHILLALIPRQTVIQRLQYWVSRLND